jgi:sugar phosphate isomerase/epimerase
MYCKPFSSFEHEVSLMKLACQEQLVPGDTLLEKWDFLASIGFDGIELQGHGKFRLRDRLPELRTARKAGVVFSSVCVVMDHFIGDFDPEHRRDAIANMKSLLSVIAEVGGVGAITPAAYGMFSRRLPPFQPPRTPDEDRTILIEGLRELGEHAKQEGVYVLFEPLNRYEDHMVNTLEDAVALCQVVDLPSVCIMADFFHMNIEEQNIAAAIKEAGSFLKHVHLADSNRYQPGAGHTDFRPGFHALQRIGFTGYMALECRLMGEPASALTETARYIRSLW